MNQADPFTIPDFLRRVRPAADTQRATGGSPSEPSSPAVPQQPVAYGPHTGTAKASEPPTNTQDFRPAAEPTPAPASEGVGAPHRATSLDGDPPSSASGPAAPAAGPAFSEKETSSTMARNGNGRGRRPTSAEFADDQTGETGREKSNAKARQQTIRDACKEIAALEAERKTISEKISEIRQTKIKGDLGMKLADFGAVYRLYKLEGDDRDAALDAIREGFKALGIGEQLDFVDAMAATPAPAADAGGFPGAEATH